MRDVHLYIVGGAIHDRSRCHLPDPSELSRLFAMFSERSYMLRVHLVDPMHRTPLDDALLQHPEYTKRQRGGSDDVAGETIYVAQEHFKDYIMKGGYLEAKMADATLERPRGIVVDFSGTWTFSQMQLAHELPTTAEWLMIPLGCDARSVSYTALLEPFVRSGSVVLEEAAWALYNHGPRHTMRMNDFLHSLNLASQLITPRLPFLIDITPGATTPTEVEVYMANYTVLREVFDACMPQQRSSQNEKGHTLDVDLHDVRRSLKEFYAFKVSAASSASSAVNTRAAEAHAFYFNKADEECHLHKKSLEAIMSGLHRFGVVKPWYTQRFSGLQAGLLPVQVYILAMVHYVQKERPEGWGEEQDARQILRSSVVKLTDGNAL